MLAACSALASAMSMGLSCLLLTSAARAVEPVLPASAASADAPRKVYQQRRADGQAVFTDRPSAGLVTERSWSIEPEDADAAAARRDASRSQADRVTERIQRSIDQQQQLSTELQIEQLRSQRAADALQAERLRNAAYDDDVRPYVLLPGRRYGRPFVDRPHGPQGPVSPNGQPIPRPAPRPAPAPSRPEPMVSFPVAGPGTR